MLALAGYQRPKTMTVPPRDVSGDKLLVVGSRAGTAWDYDQLDRIASQARLRGLEPVGIHGDEVVAYGGDALFDELVVADLDDAAACVHTVAHRDDICAALTIRERSVEATAAVAQALGLRGNDPAAVKRIRNKDRCRDWLRDHGFPQPASRLCDSRAQAEGFMHETAGPWIVKPRDNMASIGVTLVRAIHGLDAALGKLDASEPFLVETFVDGEEINVEGVMLDGRAHVLSIARKTPYDRGGFITHRLRQPAGLSRDDTAAVSDEVARAVECAGVTAGHVCVEAWLTRAGVVLGEIHARSGGGFCHLLVEQTLTRARTAPRTFLRARSCAQKKRLGRARGRERCRPGAGASSSAAIGRLAAVPRTVIDLDRARAARRDRDTRALAHLLTVTHEISDRVSPPAWWARPLLVARRRRLVRRTLRGD